MGWSLFSVGVLGVENWRWRLRTRVVVVARKFSEGQGGHWKGGVVGTLFVEIF